jgi:thiamine biosynthesis lipoprotein ApbE
LQRIAILDNSRAMESQDTPDKAQEAIDRIVSALDRISSASSRVSALAKQAEASGEGGGKSKAKLMRLINKHEAMREDVANTLIDLDKVINKLEA